jgi:GDP-L-fucose synthase
LSGPLEPTNQWYAVAKVAGIKLAQAYRLQYGCDFISVMPTNLYGPGDNFDLTSSHVVPALIAKAHRAKIEGAESLEIWGTGRPMRELLFVDDAADGMVFIMRHYSDGEIINIGVGHDLTVAELAEAVCRATGFRGSIRFDTSKPDGAPRKLVDASRLNALGWRPKVSLDEGLKRTYRWYLERHATQITAPQYG